MDGTHSDGSMLVGVQSVNVSLPSSTGVKLAGTIDFPSARPKAFAVFAHCFAGSRHTPGASRTSKRLTEYGIATLRFDFPGLGQSGGEYRDTTFSQNADDIIAAVEWLSSNYETPQLIMGHSLGGAATLKAASRLKQIKAVATIGAPFDPAHSVLHYKDKISEADANGEVTVNLGGRDLIISRAFLEDLAETNPEVYLRRIHKPLLLVHSPLDQTVGIDNAQTIFQLTRYSKSLVCLDKADHLLTREGAARQAADIIGNWVQKYLEPSWRPEKLDDSEVVSHSARGLKYGNTVRTRFGEVATDRPRFAGGKGQGHSSLDLLQAAIAAASSEAARNAAKGMKLDDVRVSVARANDGTFRRHISLEGSLSDAEARTLLEAAHSSEIDRLFTTATIVDV